MSAEETNLTQDLAAAADLLTGGLQNVSKSVDVEKGENPFAKKDDEGKEAKDSDTKGDKKDGEKEEKTEKSITLTESELSGLLTRAATAGAEAAVTTVEKSLGLIDQKITASMKFQKASSDVLGQIGTIAANTSSAVEKLDEVTKAIQSDVVTIGEQSAPRKTVDLAETEKSVVVTETPKKIDLAQLREVTKSMEVWEAITVHDEVQAGNYNRLTPLQRAQLGL